MTDKQSFEQRVREALEFYATTGAACRKLTGDGDAARHALDRDGGKLAREALSLLAARAAPGGWDEQAKELEGSLAYADELADDLRRIVTYRLIAVDAIRALKNPTGQESLMPHQDG